MFIFLTEYNIKPWEYKRMSSLDIHLINEISDVSKDIKKLMAARHKTKLELQKKWN